MLSPMTETAVLRIPFDRWNTSLSSSKSSQHVAALESGAVLHFPNLRFELTPEECRFLTPSWGDGKAKNISFDIGTGKLAGAHGPAADLACLGQMIARFAGNATSLIASLCPSYQPHLSVTRTSFRTIEASTRASSWRQDDRRLHVDAFPSRPNHGKRILRVFTNVNPEGKPRVWRVGEPFEKVAARFLPDIRPQFRGVARCLLALRITKSLRTPYDHIMLGLHDCMKSDATYQASPSYTEVSFETGSTWVCFSDQVAHAALHGQYMLEQTLELPVDAMQDSSRSPLRILERLTHARLTPASA